MKKYVALIASLGILSIACERIIPFDSSVHEPMITLYSSVSSGDTIQAHISRSISMVDEGTPPNDSLAVIVLAGDDGTIDTLVHQFQGHYRSHIVASEGVTYDYTVTREPLPTATAQVTALIGLGNVNLVMIDTGSQAMQGGWSIPFTEVELTIPDAGDPVYYEIEGISQYTDPSTGEIYEWGLAAATDDPLLGGKPYGQSNVGGATQRIWFSNESFIGQSRVISLRIYGNVQGPEKLGVKVTKMDESKYFYEKQIEQSGKVGPFTQPVVSYVNVTNGLGCVYSSAEVSVFL